MSRFITSTPRALVAREGGTDALPGSLRVLVVSDQEVWLRSLDSVLGARGYAVTGAECGAEAIERTRQAPPDLLVIATHLRDMAGLALFRSLREEALIGPETPVVLISSGPCTREERLRALRAGAWDLYGSPPDVEVLLLKLDIYSRARRQEN